MPIQGIYGRPGIGSAVNAQYGLVFRSDEGKGYFPHGGIIDGASRYYAGGTNLFWLPPGLLMGQVTATKKWRPCFLGVTQGAYTSGGTSITVTPAQAAEIVRRVGASGSLTYVGPPTAAGTVASITQNFSAVNTGTGVITTTSLGANLIAGGFVVAGDGSEIPRSVVDDGLGVNVPLDGTDTDWPRIPNRGQIQSDRILDWPTDTSLQQWIKDRMCAHGRGLFTFSDEYAPAA